MTTFDELLPRLYTEYRITRDPERHAIAGWSSGAIAAFTVAWERPDQFRKVLSGIGTYVNLAGGHTYPEKDQGERAEADSHLHDRRPQRQPGREC